MYRNAALPMWFFWVVLALHSASGVTGAAGAAESGGSVRSDSAATVGPGSSTARNSSGIGALARANSPNTRANTTTNTSTEATTTGDGEHCTGSALHRGECAREPPGPDEFDCIFKDGPLGMDVHKHLLVVTSVSPSGQAASDGCDVSHGALLVSIRGRQLTPLDLLEPIETDPDVAAVMARRRKRAHRRRRRLLPRRRGRVANQTMPEANAGSAVGSAADDAHAEATRRRLNAYRRSSRAHEAAMLALAYTPRPMRLRFRRPSDTYHAVLRHAILGLEFHNGVVTTVAPRSGAARQGVTVGSVLVAVGRAHAHLQHRARRTARDGNGNGGDSGDSEGPSRDAVNGTSRTSARGSEAAAAAPPLPLRVLSEADRGGDELKDILRELGRPLRLRFLRDGPTARPKRERQRRKRQAAVARAVAARRAREAEAAVAALRAAEQALDELDGKGKSKHEVEAGATSAKPKSKPVKLEPGQHVNVTANATVDL